MFIKTRKGQSSSRCKMGISKPSNSIPSNSHIIYYKGERATLKTQLYNEFIMMTMDKPYLNQQTKDQLGYQVYCTNRDEHGILGISILVEPFEDKDSLTYLNENIESFLKIYIKNLKKISEKKLKILKESLMDTKLIPDLTFKARVEKDKREIINGTHMYDRRERELPLISSLTLEKVAAHLNKLIRPANNNMDRNLSVQVMESSTSDKELLPCNENSLEKSTEEIIELVTATEEDRKEGLFIDQNICQLRSSPEQLTVERPENMEILD